MIDIEMRSYLMNAVCQYHDRDVMGAFPGFTAPEREDALTLNGWGISVEPWPCDGIVAMQLTGVNGVITLTMGTKEARELAAALIERAHIEDAKLIEDEDEDEDDSDD